MQQSVEVTDQTFICSLVSLMPIDSFITQKYESLKYEKNNEPTQAARPAKTGSNLSVESIGATTDADVSIATEPEP
jgi:hypothetical protein